MGLQRTLTITRQTLTSCLITPSQLRSQAALLNSGILQRRWRTKESVCSAPEVVEKIRNIGIIAHVDAGKTTTTERMLLCSGYIPWLGRVDEGSTTTDFMELEREKGITIQSAAITFKWPPAMPDEPRSEAYRINLIDTPGHQDFRFEVDRCLPILDGAICIIDGVEGVEAHTERVWASSHQHKIPRIMFINKLDRQGASFRKSILDVASRLKTHPLVCQIPLYSREKLSGVIDIIDKKVYRWAPILGNDKVTMITEPLSQLNNDALQKEVRVARENLINILADYDPDKVEAFLEDVDNIDSQVIKESIRKVIQEGDGTVVPIFAGASLRQIGVEPLLDAVVDYLPSPLDRPEIDVTNGKELIPISKAVIGGRMAPTLAHVAHVFKVMHHPKHGVLSFVRIYYGIVLGRTPQYNTRLQEFKRPKLLAHVYADKLERVQHLDTGQIAVMQDLPGAQTGDTLISYRGGTTPHGNRKYLAIRPPVVPPAVAFVSIEPFGKAASTELMTALTELSREDPSLRFQHDEKEDVFILQGMGKLHLDVTIHELKRRYDPNACFSDVSVDFKETLDDPVTTDYITYDKLLAGRMGSVTVSVTVTPMSYCPGISTSTIERDGNFFDIYFITVGPADQQLVRKHYEEASKNLVNGAYAGLARGPKKGFPVHSCHVSIQVSEGDLQGGSPGHFAAAARTAVQTALKQAMDQGSISILEPVMKVCIIAPQSAAGQVQHDLTSGAGGVVLDIKDVTDDSESSVDLSTVYAPPDLYDTVATLREKTTTRRVQIVANVPYKEIIDYDEHLRSRTGGRHTMTMDFAMLDKMSVHREKGV